MIDHFAQAAMLKADTLVRQHPVSASLELAAYRDVRRIGAVIVDAGVALGIHADTQVGTTRARDENAQVGGHQHVRILAHRIVGLNCAMVQGHHEGAARRIVNRTILSQVNTAGRAKAERTTTLQRDIHGLGSGGDFAAIAQQGLPVRDVHGARNLYFSGRGSSDGLLSMQRRQITAYGYGSDQQ